MFGVPDKDLRRRVMGTEPGRRALARERSRELAARIWELRQKGLSQHVIAQRLGVCDYTVSRELKRMRGGYYERS